MACIEREKREREKASKLGSHEIHSTPIDTFLGPLAGVAHHMSRVCKAMNNRCSNPINKACCDGVESKRGFGVTLAFHETLLCKMAHQRLVTSK
jgi:hypothetical protein